MEFDAPSAEHVLEILAGKARSDGRLAAQIEAAQWQAIAVTQAASVNETRQPENTGDDS